MGRGVAESGFGLETVKVCVVCVSGWGVLLTCFGFGRKEVMGKGADAPLFVGCGGLGCPARMIIY